MAITVLAPTFGLPIDPNSSLSLFVTATAPALKRVVVFAELVGRARTELVHKGVGYPLEYLYELSTITSYVNPMTGGTGFAYVLRRRGGWQDGVVNIRVVAYDTSGGEVVT